MASTDLLTMRDLRSLDDTCDAKFWTTSSVPGMFRSYTVYQHGPFDVVTWEVYRPEARVEHGELKDPVSPIINTSSEFLLDVVVKVFRVCLWLASPLEETGVKMTCIGLLKQ